MLIYLIVSSVLFMLLAVVYYKRQNSTHKMGGSISIPKTIWLFLALYQYFVLVLVFLFSYHGEFIMIIGVLGVLFYLRALFQGIIMYWTKRWKPLYGIIANAILSGWILWCLIAILNSNLSVYNAGTIYLIGTLLFLMTDTYYAYHFNKLVAGKTMGESAIWFANQEDPKFIKLNRVTAILNIFFVAYIIFEFIILYSDIL